MADLDGRDVAALTQYMTTLEDVDRARGADSLYVVVAQSGREYLVDAETGACECDDSFYRHPEGGCKHVRRVEFATGRREIPAWVDRSRVDAQLGIHVSDVDDQDDSVDRGDGIETDGGTDQGAIDQDFEDAERSYDDRVAEALADVPTEPLQGGVAIDIVTRQAVLVRRQVAETCREYYDENSFDLVTYKMHPWLPGIGPENAVYECVYIDGNPQNAHKPGKTYDFPSARLMALPLPMAWDAFEVGSL
jgi:hypothetical protein